MFESLQELVRRTAPEARTRETKRPVGKALLFVGAVIVAALLVGAALVVW